MDDQYKMQGDAAELHPELEGLDLELEEGKDQSALSRYINAFFAPGKAFKGLLRTGRKWPIIGIGAVLAIVCFAISQFVLSSSPEFINTVKKKQLEQYQRMYDKGNLPKSKFNELSDDLDDYDQSKYLQNASFGLLAFPIIWAIFGVIMLILAKILEQDKDKGLGFLTAVCMTLIGSGIGYLELLLKSAVIYLTGNPDFSISLGAFFDTQNLILQFLMSLVNPFTVWSVVVTGIGLAMIARRQKKNGIIAWGLTYVVGGAALAGVGQLLMSIFA